MAIGTLSVGSSLEKLNLRMRAEMARCCGPASDPKIQSITPERLEEKWGRSYSLHSAAQGLRFIHIGKCGGTSIMHGFLNSGIALKEYHMRRPAPNFAGHYFIWIRDPISRLVSAFNHAKTILEFNPEGLEAENLTLDNCPAPEKIRRRISTGITFSAEYDTLVNKFEDANSFAECLTARSPRLRSNAQALLVHPDEHIYRGIGWYLGNGAWVRRKHRQILKVGCVETMAADFRKLVDRLEWNHFIPSKPTHQRSGVQRVSEGVSPKARKNLRAALDPTDYAALRALHETNLLSTEKMDRYIT